MGGAGRINLNGWALRATLWLVWSTAIPSGVSIAQAPPPLPPNTSESSRIDRLERILSTVAEENRRLADEVRTLKEKLAERPPSAPSPSLPAPSTPSASLPERPRRNLVRAPRMIPHPR